MKTHRFTFVTTGLDPKADDFEDRFFEAGCGDATISYSGGAILLEFERQAESRADAIAWAVADMERAGLRGDDLANVGLYRIQLL